MDISEPYTNNTIGRGRGGRGRGRNEPREVPLGMVIDRTSRLHIRNIPQDAIESEGADALKAEFATFGPIDRYVLFSDRTGRFTGAGMATFRNPADARQAVAALHGRQNTDGSKLIVTIAQEHGVVLTRDLNTQRWEKREEQVRNNAFIGDEQEEEDPNSTLGAKDRSKRGYNADGSWSHDMFDKMQRGERVRTRGGYHLGRNEGPNSSGRGRGGNNFGRGGGGFQRAIDNKFEQYIQQRDGLVLQQQQGAGAPPQQAGDQILDVVEASYNEGS